MLSLYATAAKSPAIREIGVTNTTSTALTVAVARFTTATNVGAGLAETSEADPVSVAEATIFAGHTGDGGAGGIVRLRVGRRRGRRGGDLDVRRQRARGPRGHSERGRDHHPDRHRPALRLLFCMG